MDTRRDQIVAAARRLLEQDPNSTLAVRAVAGEAGIGASTLRHYFPTQRALREAVLEVALGEQPSELDLRNTARPPVDRLVECLEQLLPAQALVDGLPFERWVETLSGIFGRDGTPARREHWTAQGAQLRRVVAGWLGALAEEDLVARGTEERSARLLMAVVDGLAFARIAPGVPLDPAHERGVLEDAARAVLRATS